MIELYKSIERWVHRQHMIVSSISHLVIVAGLINLFGLPIGGIMLLAGVGGIVTMLGVLTGAGVGAYTMREHMNTEEKGFRQAARDGDTLFGPDFMFAVAGGVAGFTIARAILGV